MALAPFGVGFDPFFDNLERSIDRAFTRTFGGAGPLTTLPTGGSAAPALWGSVAGSHPMDVVETDKTYEIHADAPGFTPEDIHVEMHEGQISIRGEKQVQQEQRDEAGKVWRKERAWRSFHRTFALPDNANPEEVSAGLDKGVLKVVVAKKPEAAKPEPKRITVKATE